MLTAQQAGAIGVGAYELRLTVTDFLGISASAIHTLTVVEQGAAPIRSLPGEQPHTCRAHRRPGPACPAAVHKACP